MAHTGLDLLFSSLPSSGLVWKGKDISRNCGISEQGTSDLEDVLSERLEQLPLPASRLTSIDAAQPNAAASLPYPANEDQVRLYH